MPNYHLGIDIRRDGVTAVLLGSRLKSTSVMGHWSVAYPDGGYTSDNLAAAVSAVVAMAGVEKCDCAVSIPAEWAYIRRIRLPFRDKKKIDKILFFEMEPLLPVGTEEVVIDYRIAAQEDAHSIILAAAVETSVLSDVTGSLESCHLKPGMVTLGGCASLALLAQSVSASDDIVFINAADAGAAVFLATDGDMVMLRGRAGQAPCCAADIVRTVLSYQDGSPDRPFAPGHVFFTTAPAAAESVSSALTPLFDVPVEPFHCGRIPAGAAVFDAAAPLTEETPPEALALALWSIRGWKGLNFQKEAFAVSKFWQEHRKSLIAPAMISLLIVVLGGYRSLAAIGHYQTRLDAVNRQISEAFKAAVPEVRRIVNPVHQMQTRLAEMRQEVPQFDQAGQSRSVVDILQVISQRIPSSLDVTLNQLVYGPEAITLSGETDTFNAVNAVQQRLASEPSFSNVSISSANQQKSGNRVNFKMRILL